MVFKAQVSLEVLIVLAALVGMLAAFAPSIGKVSHIAKGAFSQKQFEFGVEKIAAGILEAERMGSGFEMDIELNFPGHLNISASNGKLRFEFWGDGFGGSIEKDILGRVEFGAGGNEIPLIGKGRMRISNVLGIAKISLAA